MLLEKDLGLRTSFKAKHECYLIVRVTSVLLHVSSSTITNIHLFENMKNPHTGVSSANDRQVQFPFLPTAPSGDAWVNAETKFTSLGIMTFRGL